MSTFEPTAQLAPGTSTQPLAPPTTPAWSVVQRVTLAVGIVVVLLFTARGAEIDPALLARGGGNMLTYLQGYLSPNFADWRLFVDQMWVTVQVAIWGTFLAVVCSVPLGLLASSNVAPFWLRRPVRLFMDAARAVNEMVFALIFISAVGIGPFAGVLALFIHTTGVLAKLFSEAVESIDPRPVEGIRAVGATRVDEAMYGILPQVLPLWTSYTLYRFESNVRSASVVGMVGAGGIGQLLLDAIRGFDYGRTSAMLLIIIAVVIALDFVSARIRARLV